MTNSKAKGKRGELELVRKLKEFWPGLPWRRSQQFCGYVPEGQADIIGGLDGLHIECKRVEAGSKTVYKWLNQAETDAARDEIPVVMHKSNINQWICIVSLYNLPALAEAIENGKR